MDSLGTLFVKVDQAGNPIETCAQNPFGESLGCSPGLDYTETHFTDKLRDQESSLDYSGARYYNSTLGRFTIPDPTGLGYADPTNPQSLNLYSYAQNNPLSNSDPTGLSCITLTNADFTPQQGDDGDGNGCSDAGILPNGGNGNSTQFDPNKTQTVNVTPPLQGQDQSYDAQVAYDQQYLQLQQQQQQAPTPEMYLQAIAQATAATPNACGYGLNVRLGGGRLSAGLDLSTTTGFKFAYGARGGLPGGAGGKPGPVSLSITGKGSKLSVSGNVRIGPTPFSIGLGSSTGETITSVNVAVRYGLASIQAYTNISNFGDPRCK